MYPEGRRNPFFHRCQGCRAPGEDDWTVWDTVFVAAFVVVMAGIAFGLSWWILAG